MEVVEGVAVYVDIAACHHLPQYAVVVEHVGYQGFLDLVACTRDRADGVPLGGDAGETGMTKARTERLQKYIDDGLGVPMGN